MVMLLGEDEIRRLLRWDPLIAAMEEALAAFSRGEVLQPVRNMLTIEEGRRYLGVMPAVAADAMGAKLVSFYPGNAEAGLPTHLALIVLFRPDTGEPLAVMDGRLITEMRTAAVSAAATKRLSAADSRVLALLGSGVQAQAHLEALSRIRKFDEIRVWSRTAAHAERFAARHGVKAMPAEAAVRGADVVVTATAAREPILKGAWLKAGALVVAVGAPRPDWRELDDPAMANVLVVNSRAAVLKESGDVILSRRRDPGRDRRDLRRREARADRSDDGVQIGRARGRGHRRGKARLRPRRRSFPEIVQRPVVAVVGNMVDPGERRGQRRAGVAPQMLDDAALAAAEIGLVPDIDRRHGEPAAGDRGAARIIDVVARRLVEEGRGVGRGERLPLAGSGSRGRRN